MLPTYVKENGYVGLRQLSPVSESRHFRKAFKEIYSSGNLKMVIREFDKNVIKTLREETKYSLNRSLNEYPNRN